VTHLKNKLHFWELENLNCYVWLKRDFWKLLVKKKNDKKLTWFEVSKKISINYGSLRNYLGQLNNTKKAQFIPLDILIKLLNQFDIKLKIIEKNNWLAKIRSGKSGSSKPSNGSIFPINFLKEDWGSFIGALLSECHIKDTGEINFSNKDIELIKNFINFSNELTGLKETVKTYKRKNGKVYFYVNYPEIVGKILIRGLEIKLGKKTIQNPPIPPIYLNSNNFEIIGHLLSWLFSGDGWITIFKDHLGQTHRAIGICFGSSKKDQIPQLLLDTMMLLDKLNIKYNKPFQEIKTTKKGKITYSWKIFIKGENNFVKFRERVNFATIDKRKKLDKMINSYVKPKLGNNESFLLVVNSVNKISKIKGYATKHDICETAKLNKKWVEKILKRAVDRNCIKIVGGGERCRNEYGRVPYFYVSGE